MGSPTPTGGTPAATSTVSPAGTRSATAAGTSTPLRTKTPDTKDNDGCQIPSGGGSSFGWMLLAPLALLWWRRR
jgi:hypothetical protein